MQIRSDKFIYWATLTLLAVMPFHAFIVVLAGSSLSIFPAFNIWKEVLLTVMGVAVIEILLKDRDLARKLWSKNWNKAAVIYIVLHLIYAAFSDNSLVVTLSALKTNLSFIVFFLIAQLAYIKQKNDDYQLNLLEKAIIYPALVVGVVAILQLFIPPGWIEILGYSESTIEPFIPIKDSSIPRAFSTTSGPNQLASYLLLPLAFVIWRWLKTRSVNWLYLALVLGVALIASFSRSGWLAATLISAILLYRYVDKQWLKKLIIASPLFLIVILAPLLYLAPQVRIINNLVLHGDHDITHESLLEGSTAGHIRAFAGSLDDITEDPLGMGLAEAGPVSILTGKPFITESYYLQIALEVGITGIAIFLWLLYAIGRKLYELSNNDPLGMALFTSLIGLTVTNLVLHVWADSTTSLVWWGAAGAYLGIRTG